MSWAISDALIDFHARYTGAATHVFGPGRMPDGQSSYEWLASRVRQTDADVLELGCGDGYLLALMRGIAPKARLTGLDMSRAELRRARRRFNASEVLLVEGWAQTLAFANESQDIVVSHMAIMLMEDVGRVVGEVERVLRGGGRVAAVVGRRGGDLPEVQRRFFGKLEALSRGEDRRISWPEDSRIHSEEGIRSLFANWSSATVENAVIEVDVGRDVLWQFLQVAYYGAGLLSDDASSAMRAFVEGGMVGDDRSVVRWLFPIRLIEATK
jgi:ubiquinone/menaquinone biosynthesis C-methylase UbiE